MIEVWNATEIGADAMSNLFLSGGDVVVGGAVRRGDVRIVDGRVAEVGDLVPRVDEPTHDCTGQLVSPGFIDLQCNGAVGEDLTVDPTQIATVARHLPRTGVTSWLPTIVTSHRATRRAAIEAISAFDDAAGAQPLGLHFEGPALNPAHVGAHDPRLVTLPETAEVGEWCDSGAVRMVTLAPELAGALEIVEQLAMNGVLVAAGHTAMTPADLDAAVRVGVRYATHLYNAMSPLHHRAPGAVGAVLGSRDVVAGIICDRLHVDPVAVRIAHAALGPDRVSLVSDASAALGSPYGSFRLGSREVTHTEQGARLGDRTLAGSAIGVDSAVRNYRDITGCSAPEAIAAATSTPARLLGLPARGHLAEGAIGDVTVLDRDLHVVATIIGGTLVWKS